MNELRYTLLSDGSSNKALMSILTWLLQQHMPGIAIHGEWADLRRLPKPPSRMAERIQSSLDLYPCELLFIHRDAESASPGQRSLEIDRAVQRAKTTIHVPPIVYVIPVRMLEAWLLFDLAAVRRAAGNPHGSEPVNLPSLRSLENMADPKAQLHRILCEASRLHGRRLKTFNHNSAVHRIAEYIEDFSPLRALPAFQGLEDNLKETIALLDRDQ